MKKHLLNSKLITNEQWEEYQMFKQSKEMVLNKISIVKNKIKNKEDIDKVIKDMNDILKYLIDDKVWQEYHEMDKLFSKTYHTCLVADTKGD